MIKVTLCCCKKKGNGVTDSVQSLYHVTIQLLQNGVNNDLMVRTERTNVIRSILVCKIFESLTVLTNEISSLRGFLTTFLGRGGGG